MDTPTATYVMQRAPRFDWAGAGYPEADDLTDEVLDAVEYVEGVTWRKLDATMPAGVERRAARAVVLRVQQQVVQSDPDNVEAASDELFSSSSASGVSESRRAWSEHESANKALLINKWPQLNDLLIGVMTPEALAWWIALLTGEMPAIPLDAIRGGFNVMEVAWDAAHYAPYQDVTPGWLINPDTNDLPTVSEPYGSDDPLPNW